MRALMWVILATTALPMLIVALGVAPAELEMLVELLPLTLGLCLCFVALRLNRAPPALREPRAPSAPAVKAKFRSMTPDRIRKPPRPPGAA